MPTSLGGNLAPHEHDTATEIVSLLSKVVRSRAGVLLQGGEEIVAARIDAVHLGPPHLSVTCLAAFEAVERALKSETLQLRAEAGLARLEFTVLGREVYALGSEGEISVPLPKQLIRFDRRVHYRCVLPSGLGVRCEVDHPSGSIESYEAYDISLGGVGLKLNAACLSLKVGDQVRNCRIRLPGYAPFSVGLEIRCLTTGGPPSEGGVARVGCQFLGRTLALESAIQSLMALCH